MDETIYDAQKRFQEKLAFGQVAEWQIEVWLRHTAKCCVLPVREGGRDNKGPRLFLPKGELIAPDMLAIRGKDIRWIEAKHKTVFSWYHNGQRWETGIDLHAFEQYRQIAQMTPWPVWLLFLHSEAYGDKADEPYPCPVGLFGNDLNELSKPENISHKWKPQKAKDREYSRSGMIYWSPDNLKLIASLEDVEMAAAEMKNAAA